MISVIVSAYNAEKYIGNTLRSILNQSYRNIEIILVDDGSTDATASIGRQTAQADSRLKVIQSDKNNGAAFSRLFGVKQAIGEWLMFVDADDVLPPHAISSLLAFDNDNRDIISGTVAINGRVIPQHTLSGDITPVEYVNALLLSTTYNGACAKLIRATLFNRIPTISKEIVLNEDLLMMAYLSQYARGILILNELPVYNYMERNNSVSRSCTQNFHSWLLLFHALKPCIESFGNETLRKSFGFFMLHRIYHFLIQRGAYVSPASSDIKTVLAYQIGKTPESETIIRVIQSPIKQRIEHTKYLFINQIKKIGKYALIKTALIGKHFILEKLY